MSWKVLLEWWLQKGDRRPGSFRQRGFKIHWAVAALVLTVTLFGCYTWFNKTVTLVVDGKETRVKTFSRTVGGVLKSNEVALLDKDQVMPPVDKSLKKGMVISVKSALDANISLDGQVLQVRTQSQTVSDLLKEYAINLGPDDEVKPEAGTPVVQGMNVLVARIGTETEAKEAPVDFETENRYTTQLPQGATRVAQEGRAGAERQTWLVTYRDKIEVNRQLLSTEVISEAVNKIIMVGSGLVVSRGGEDIRYSEAVDMLSSAYSYTGYNTASGVEPCYGVVAVDTSNIPLGTKLYVEGYGYATALDRGSSITGNRIDLFFESHEEALSWGLRRVKVYVLD